MNVIFLWKQLDRLLVDYIIMRCVLC